jgi:hypothetical protein
LPNVISIAEFHYAEKACCARNVVLGDSKYQGQAPPQVNDRFNEQKNKSKENIMSTNIMKKLAGKVALVTAGIVLLE